MGQQRDGQDHALLLGVQAVKGRAFGLGKGMAAAEAAIAALFTTVTDDIAFCELAAHTTVFVWAEHAGWVHGNSGVDWSLHRRSQNPSLALHGPQWLSTV